MTYFQAGPLSLVTPAGNGFGLVGSSTGLSLADFGLWSKVAASLIRVWLCGSMVDENASGPQRKDQPRWRWPWRPFVLFGLACGLLPGFLYGVLMGAAPALGIDSGNVYAAIRQAHGHAMLMGWIGSLIIGVALHFLPRLRGAKLVSPQLVPWLFWTYLSGIALRVLGQPLAALSSVNVAPFATRVFSMAPILGTILEMVAVLGALLLLGATFRGGPALSKKKGFVQVALLIGTAGLALALAQLTWLRAALAPITQTETWGMLQEDLNRAAIEMLLFGGFMALSLGMSARLFPMTFRRAQAWTPGLQISASLLLAAVLATFARVGFGGRGAGEHALEATAAALFGFGIAVGVFAGRSFRRAPQNPRDRSRYRLWRDPAGVGVMAAYLWALLAAALLMVFGIVGLTGKEVPGGFALKDMARHAMGAGFLSMLIVSVGWTMLPGFGGGQPRGRRLMWVAVAALNLATVLRLTPGTLALAGQMETSRSAFAVCWSAAGVFGFSAIALFAGALRVSWRKSGASERTFQD